MEEDGEEGEIKGGFLGEAEMENRRTMGEAAKTSWVEAVLLCPGRADDAAVGDDDGDDDDDDDAAAETGVSEPNVLLYRFLLANRAGRLHAHLQVSSGVPSRASCLCCRVSLATY